MLARIATFEGGDSAQLRDMTGERLQSGDTLPEGVARAMVLQGERRLFITFFDSREALDAAEAHFEQMGHEIPEGVRGKRVSLDIYEVVFDQIAGAEPWVGWLPKDEDDRS